MDSSDDIEKKAWPWYVALHALTGAVVGFLVGWYAWFRLFRSEFFNSWGGFLLVVGGTTIVFAVLASCLRERFWDDWRSPFR